MKRTVYGLILTAGILMAVVARPPHAVNAAGFNIPLASATQASGGSGAAASALRAGPSLSQSRQPFITVHDPTSSETTWHLTQGVPVTVSGYALTPGDIAIGLLPQDGQLPPLIIGQATVSDLISSSEPHQSMFPSFRIQVTVPVSAPGSYSFPGMFTLFAASADAVDTPEATLSVCVSQGQDQPSCAFTITTDQKQYQVGDTAQFCYTLPGSVPFTITDSRMAGGGGVIFSTADDGDAGCLSDTLGPPAGPTCVQISSPSGAAAPAQACFTVQNVPPATPTSMP